MALYEVWATNDPFEWTQRLLETEDRQLARAKAGDLVEGRRFRFVAIDRDGVTIWSNDPDTPATADW